MSGYIEMLISGAVATAVVAISIPITRRFRKGLNLQQPLREGDAETFTYSRNTQRFLMVLGLACLVFSLGPPALIAWKYLGTHPMTAANTCCYRPQEDALAGLGLMLGFGLGAYVCLVDPRRYFARLDANGITVRGLFSGTQTLAWREVEKLKHHSSLQMIALTGGTEKKRLWIPYTLSGFARLLERLNERGILLQVQEDAVKTAKEYLEAEGYLQVAPFKLFLPVLTFWRLAPESERFIAVILALRTGVEGEVPHFESFMAPGSWLDVMQGLQQKLQRNEFGFNQEFQQRAAEDIQKIIDERKAEAAAL